MKFGILQIRRRIKMGKVIWTKLEKNHPIFTEEYETFSVRGQLRA